MYILLYGFIYYYFFYCLNQLEDFFFEVLFWIYSFLFFFFTFHASNIFAVIILSIEDQKIIFFPLQSFRLPCQQKDSWGNWIKRMLVICALQ